MRTPRGVVIKSSLAIALVAYVVVNAFCQPGFSAGWSRTSVGELCSVLRLEGQRMTCVMPDNHFAVPTADGGWRILPDGRYGDADFPSPCEVVVSQTSRRWKSGWWTQIAANADRQVTCLDAATYLPLSTSQRTSLLAAIDAQSPGAFPPSSRASDIAGGSFTRAILWLGVLNDASVVAALAGIVVLLAMALRGLERAKAGRCPRCGYDTTGLRSARCPECGCDLIPAAQ